MPYVNGKRVSLEEYLAANGSQLEQMRTGPGGENPGTAPVLDEETGAPAVKATGTRRRSGRSTKAAKAAVANALGVSTDSDVLADIDVSGDAVATEE